jgi:hypothetical protein
MSISEAPRPETFTGITPPTRRGGSSRQLTDVVIELGFADRDASSRRTPRCAARCAPRWCTRRS